jgi:hypothetical protein
MFEDDDEDFDNEFGDELVERADVVYVCKNGHETIVPFAITAKTEIPNEWDCQYCTEVAVKQGSEIEMRERKSRKKYAGDDNPAYTMLKERRPGEEGDAELQADLDAQLALLRAGKLAKLSII